LTDLNTPAAAAAAVARQPSLSTLSLHNADTVNASQFIQLMDQFLANTTDDQLVLQLMTFVCEGFVQSKQERTLRRRQVTATVCRHNPIQ